METVNLSRTAFLKNTYERMHLIFTIIIYIVIIIIIINPLFKLDDNKFKPHLKTAWSLYTEQNPRKRSNDCSISYGDSL